MAFKTAAVQRTESDAPKVDYDKFNQYVVETCNLEQPETLIGYISSIVDLGVHEQEDAETPFVGTDEDEQAEIEAKPKTYFKDGLHPDTNKPCRLKCWPQPPKQAVAVAVDFPDIIVDKGQFFGESKPLPLRVWMGGQFWLGADIGMVVARPTFLKENTKLGAWGFDKRHLFHQLAVASKLVKTDEPFSASQIDQLLGKAFQFSVQIWMKPGKGGKSYFQESIKFVGAIGRGQSAPEIVTPLHLVQFDDKNEPDAINFLPKHIVNTIKRAENFSGSLIQGQIDSRQKSAPKGQPVEDDEQEEAPKATTAPIKAVKAKAKPVVEDDDHATSPF